MLIYSQDNKSEKQTDISEYSNRDMAAVLFNIATVLRQNGNTNPFRTAAYERGARATSRGQRRSFGRGAGTLPATAAHRYKASVKDSGDGGNW